MCLVIIGHYCCGLVTHILETVPHSYCLEVTPVILTVFFFFLWSVVDFVLFLVIKIICIKEYWGKGNKLRRKKAIHNTTTQKQLDNSIFGVFPSSIFLTEKAMYHIINRLKSLQVYIPPKYRHDTVISFNFQECYYKNHCPLWKIQSSMLKKIIQHLSTLQ